MLKKKIVCTDDLPRISETNNTRTNVLFEELRKAEHAGLVLFSSGITGEPKAMLHDLDKLVASYKKDVTKEINSILFLTF